MVEHRLCIKGQGRACYHGKLFCSSQRTILVFGRGDNGRLFLFVTPRGSVLHHQDVAVQLLLVEMNNICLALLHIVSPTTTTILPLILQCKGQVDTLKPLSKKGILCYFTVILWLLENYQATWIFQMSNFSRKQQPIHLGYPSSK